MPRVVITGATGGAAPRLEINAFVRNEKFFSLYIQALQQIQDTSESDDLSFYQIGGIHGLPYTPWNNATGDVPFDPKTDQWGGYCTHGSVLFPTWHRPYVALIEQTIQTKAKAIAAAYTVDKAGWQEAAENLRQPYWDWAANTVPPNEVIAMENVQITGPNGNRITVPNPLFKYIFHTRPTKFPAPYNHWETTYRHPTTKGPNPTTNVDSLRKLLKALQGQVRRDTYRMLVGNRSWQDFSNHTLVGGSRNTNSLESIHDTIHIIVGSMPHRTKGQIGDTRVAGFDPIFFLHHANVDRLLSLWAAIHPSIWVTPGDSNKGTFTTEEKSPVDKNTPLTPFWNTPKNESFWASYSTRSTDAFGYYYPEFHGLDIGNRDAVQAAIAQAVNRLYSPSFAPELDPWAIKKPMLTAQPHDTSHAASGAEVPTPNLAAPPSSHGDVTGWAWTARITFEKYELNGPFSVILFLGPVPENPDDWFTSPSFVGMHSAFVGSGDGECANCRRGAEAGVLQEGFVHLDDAIIRLAGLANLNPGVVDPWLAQQLTWKIVKADEDGVTLETLEIGVFATPMSFPISADFPVAGEKRYFNHITFGKVGGSRSA